MKKLFALLVVAGMVFVSCGNKTEEVVNEDATAATEEVINEAVAQDDATAEVEEPAAEEVVAE